MLIAKVDLSVSVKSNDSVTRRQVSWHKASSEQIVNVYTKPVEAKINAIIAEHEIDIFEYNTEHYLNKCDKIDYIVEQVQSALISQGENLPQRKYDKKLKPYWTESLTILSKDSKIARKEWTFAGKPDDPLHPAKIKYKEAKNNFRREQRRIRHDYELKCMEELSNTQQMDQRYFWYLINKSRKSYNRITPIKNDDGVILTDVNEIREDWNNYYKNLFTDDHKGGDSEFKRHVKQTLNQLEMNATRREFLNGGPISENEIKKHVSKMKNNKAPGWDGVTKEHVKHGGPNLYCFIAWLFNALSVLEIIPSSFKKGLIVSIPKRHNDLSVKSNHRGITLLPVLYKLFEGIMLERENEYFSNVMHELQGAAQERCSSIHTSMVVQEAIEYNRSRGANVWVAFLDIRKAFDTVWIPGMLYKLHETGMSRKMLSLIKNGYTDFMCAALVGGSPGDWFMQSRGVHQGSPISMKIYQVYINDLIKQLCNGVYTVRIGNINVTSPTFADDLSIMAYHTHAMNQLLGVANRYSVKWQFSFGLPKCMMMLWGSERGSEVRPKLGGHALTLVPSTKHMGLILVSDNKNTADINRRVAAAQSVVLSARGIGSFVNPVIPSILSKLYWAIGVSRMTYGLEVKPVSDSEINILEKAHRKFAKLIQSLPENTPNPMPLATIGWLSMNSYIAMKKIMFLWQILYLTSTNIYRQIATHVILGVGPRCPQTSLSPIKEMYRMAWRYKMGLDIWDILIYGTSGSLNEKTKVTKQLISENETFMWKATCILYGNISDNQSIIKDVKMLSWWKYVRKKPSKMKQVSCLVAVISGTQPKGMQTNFQKTCQMCNERFYESPEHVLMRCPHLRPQRLDYSHRIKSQMPEAMKNCYEAMTLTEKCTFLLSGFNSSYTDEWASIYGVVADFVYEMYRCRYIFYEDTDLSTSLNRGTVFNTSALASL